MKTLLLFIFITSFLTASTEQTPSTPPAVVAPTTVTAPAVPDSAPVVEAEAPDYDRAVDVWLIPVAGFPDALTVDLIARLEKDTGLHARAGLEAGITPDLFFPDSKQMNADRALTQYAAIPDSLGRAKPKTIYLFLTTHDLNGPDRRFRFLFSANHVAKRRAILSIARLMFNADGQGEAPALTKRRLYKMAKRQVGEMYYGYPRSSDLNSVMYSPLMGLDDVDMIGTDF